MRSVTYKDKYIVYEDGNVYSLSKNKMMKPTLQKNGYYKIYICNKNTWLHRFIMEAFNGKSDLTVDHIDGNVQNNNLSNLEYVTQAENTRRMFERVGTAHLKNNLNGEIYGCKKLVYKGLKFNSINELARKMGLNRKTVKNRIKKGILNVEFEG
ncbi:putative HNH endonuclease [Lactococcus phage 37201]|uniref:Putative HNH endonuclease n=1 Tax=Lactococcus phage 37201 TaxID=2029661 RepID=A0A343JNY3_9CAUD|nr:HNH endonuclease [Lactococcus phage 37201]ASZ71206.1 putative HNH endonuclease [Lactococcus phage 37201]